MDSWVIFAQGHFTKHTDLFPRKINKSLNRCPMKAVVRDGHWKFTAEYVNHTDSNGSVVRYIEGLEMDLLRVVLQQMNMTFLHVPTPKGFEMDNESRISDFFIGTLIKEIYIALGVVGINYWTISFFEFTNPHYILRVRWYVPCSVKYPRWSSIFRILSLELWVVLIISILITAISATLVGRYSFRSEWQGYKTMAGSLTNVWAVILGVSVSTIPRTPSLRSLFLAWVVFSVAFSTVFQAFLTTFLIDSGYETPIQGIDELLASGIKLAYLPRNDIIFDVTDETEASIVRRNRLICPSSEVCANWAKYQNVSILFGDLYADEMYAGGGFVGETSKRLVCGLDDGVVFTTGLIMIMFHGDPLLKRVSEIVDRVVEAGLYNYWISQRMRCLKLGSRKIAIVPKFNEYYSFNVYHLLPAFCLLLMGWCISALCFVIELLYNGVLSKRK
jgi:hypothetical protein